LRSSVLKSAGWIFLEKFGSQLIRFFVSILLARVLSPEDFGLIAMITIVISVGQSLKDSGMTQSLIRSKTITDVDYSTVFYSNIAFSIAIYLIIYAVAPLIAKFYGQEELTIITRVLSVQIIIQSVSAIQIARLTKSMNFKRQLLVQLPSFVVSGIVGIYLAYNGFGVWSLVYMTLVQVTLVTVQYWIRSSWKPLLLFDKQSFIKHFFYGYKIAVSGILDVIFKNLYNVIIGKYFSPALLGFYNRAYTLRELPIQNISATLNKLTFPMFAKIQDDDQRLKLAYSKVIQVVFFGTTPLMIMGLVLAEPLVVVLLTDKWLASVPFLRILCISGIVYPLNAYNMNILKVKGRSDLYLRIESIKKVLQLIGIILIIPFGIFPLLWFQVAFSFLSFVMNSYYSGRMIGLSIFDQVRSISGILVLAVGVGAVIYLFDNVLSSGQVSEIFRLGILSVTGMSLYILFSILFKVKAYQLSLEMIKSYKAK
jgi:teichuronic acid exporter